MRIAFSAGDCLGNIVLAEIMIAILRIIYWQVSDQRIEYLTIDFAALEYCIKHVAAERMVIGKEVFMESGYGRTMEHHRREVAEHSAFDVMPQKYCLPVSYFQQCGVGSLLFNHSASFNKTECAAHNHRKECIRAPISFDDFLIQLFKADIAAFALILESSAMAVGEWHSEIIGNPFGNTRLTDFIGNAIENNKLTIQSLAGTDSGIAVLKQLADSGGAFKQTWNEQSKRAVLIQHIGTMFGNRMNVLG